MKKIFTAFIANAFLFTGSVLACDLCAIHNSLKTEKDKEGAFDLSIAEQYTNYSRLQNEGGKIENDGNQRMDSYITQFSIGYGITDRLGLQFTLPLIFRDYKRFEEGVAQTGSENGIGDVSLLARYTLFQQEEAEQTIIIKSFLGVKLPTGDSSRINEEAAEGNEDGEVEEESEHGHDRSFDPRFYHAGHVHADQIPSGIHGHDLALGSGSIDTLLGLSGFFQYNFLFSMFDLQYSWRNEGDYDYRFGNDFLWSAGSGFYLLTNHQLTIGLLANLSGESKQKDVYQGNKAGDTEISSVFLGPELVFKIYGNIHAFSGIDFPLIQDNSDIQEVSAYRLRFGVGTRF